MNVPELLDRKRRGERLESAEIEALVGGYARGDVPDYQVAAWLMAVCCQGMDSEETTALTEAMVRSGRQLDLSSLGRRVLDKHSTGGVGDKTSLLVVPIVAASGVPVAKLSGRGLGFTGGTLDKLESIPGLTVDLAPDRFIDQVARIGAAIAGQTADLAPADGKLYALRDVTGTVPSIPLIASSVMSKKLAGGAQAIVLDVKCGRGAFMATVAEAIELAGAMIEIGRRAGRAVSAFVTDMDQPLGRMVGNALEVREVVSILRGEPGDDRLLELVTKLAGEMLWLGGGAPDSEAGRARAGAALADGSAFKKLKEIVAAQGGDVGALDDPSRLPTAALREIVPAPRDGFVTDADPLAVARAANRLGAGRERKGDPIDHAVGVELAARRSDRVAAGDPLAVIHANDSLKLTEAQAAVAGAFEIADEPPPPRPVVREWITTG
ncbi:MAG: thymidine phosphorylase [Chloroflexota bacterium]|nr:thymidine phosphorylase [Chloroflexota bacterium]